MGTNTLETVVIIIYFIGMILVGIIVSRKVKNSQDYLAAGRRLPFWLVTATLFATWWGGGTILGGSGAAFHGGFHAVMYDPYGAGLTLILAGFLFMKIVHDAKVNTAAQFFSCRYGKWASTWSGILMVPTYCLWGAVQLVAIGKVFEYVLGWPYAVTILIGTAIILIYTVLGGMLAVSWTDFFQVIILLIGLIIIFPLAVRLAGGWSEVKMATPAHFFKIFPARGSEYAPPTLGGWAWWWGAILGVGLGTLAAPDLYQRAWILGAIPVWLAFVAITLIANGGMPAAMVEIVEADSETLILVLTRLVLPPVLSGVFIASLLAMIMSSGDSALFAPAAVLANDIWKPLWEKSTKKELGDKALMNASRWSVIIIALIALLIGFFAETMYDLLIVAFQLLYHVLFFPIILGVYWKRANAPGAVAGMITGFLFIMIWMALSGTMFPSPEWASTLIPGGVGGVVMVIVSLITQKTRPPQPLYTSDGKVLKWPELAK
jgi:Na+/proline symporter